MSKAKRPAYQRILLKLRGEALLGSRSHGIDAETCASFARQIKDVRSLGVKVAVVVGGGNIFRGQVESKRFGLDQSVASSLSRLSWDAKVGQVQANRQRPGSGPGVDRGLAVSVPIQGTGRLRLLDSHQLSDRPKPRDGADDQADGGETGIAPVLMARPPARLYDLGASSRS